MKTIDLKPKYRILVVKDQSKYFETAFQNAVNLAKKIGGSIDLLYVKSLSKVVSHENQLAAWRELHQQRTSANKTVKEVADRIAATEEIPIEYNFTFGNLINEVRQHIIATRPDIIVLGKQKTKAANLMGMDLTSYLMKNHKGALLISSDKQAISSQNDLVLGLLDDFLVRGNSKLSEDLVKCTGKPITLLKINSSTDEQVELKDVVPTNLTTFEFDQGTNISGSISKYIQRSGVSLLCVRKSRLLDLSNKLRTTTKQIHKIIQQTNTPVLVLEN